jgi:type II secretory pathway component PulF
MVAVGEESGELENILTQIAESYDEEIEIATAKLTSVIEPIMILAMAGIVGFIVASILLPMLEMSTM